MDGTDMVDGPFEIFVGLEIGEIVEVLKEQLGSIEKFDKEEMEELLKDEEMKLVYDVFLHYYGSFRQGLVHLRNRVT